MIFVIIGAVVNVPRLLNDLNAIAANDKKKRYEYDVDTGVVPPQTQAAQPTRAYRFGEREQAGDQLFERTMIHGDEYDSRDYASKRIMKSGEEDEAVYIGGNESITRRDNNTDDNENVIDIDGHQCVLGEDDSVITADALKDDARCRAFIAGKLRAATMVDDSDSDSEDNTTQTQQVSPARRPI
jgi:hypothetical protein